MQFLFCFFFFFNFLIFELLVFDFYLFLFLFYFFHFFNFNCNFISFFSFTNAGRTRLMFVWIRSAMQVSGLSWSVQCARYWECNTQWNWKRYLWHEWNPRVSTLQQSRPETNVSTKTTCRLTLRSLLRGSVVPSQVSSGLLLNTLLAEPEFNVLVVVWSGERSTRGTTRITGCDTAQIERILDKTCDHSTPLDTRLCQAMRMKTT